MVGNLHRDWSTRNDTHSDSNAGFRFAFVGSFGRCFFFWAASLLSERLGAAESARAFVGTGTFAKLWLGANTL